MSLSRMIYKTPIMNEKSNVYEVDQIDNQLLQRIIQSRFIGEGVYSLEQFSMGDYKELYFSSPIFDKYSNNPTQKEWNLKDDISECAIFELVLEKPLFLPLDTTQFADLFNSILNIPHVSVLTQVLFTKRQDEWRELAISQYEQYLKGNENPLSSKFTIKLQEKMLNVFAKFYNFQVKRERTEEIEQKILQNNYRLEVRFVLFEKKYANNFVAKMEKNLQKLALFNQFSLKNVKNKRNFVDLIKNRQFQVEYVNQLLSESELFSLLSNGKPGGMVKVELEKPIKQQGVLKNLEDSMLLQRAIQIMPQGEKKNIEIDQSKVQQINQAFKRVNLVKKSMKVMEIFQGNSLLKVQMEYPDDITYSKIKNKTEDIQGALGNQNVSIEMGDKPDTVNVFLPLEERGVLYFRDVLEDIEFQEFAKKSNLPFIIGESVNGGLIFGDLTKLRHILVSGTNGSGKSVFVNLIILSLLLNVPPEELSMYLIDPKMVEFTRFDGFPQVRDIITDMTKATSLLDSLVAEMEKRFEILSKTGVRDIQGYNELNKEKMKYIVCAIDEFADLMMVNRSVEDYVVRLGQKARAAGIHLIIATQRPSVDVITGLIKANMPCRIAFSMTSTVDSKTILDKGGAEHLLGNGDGLAKIEGNKHEFERFQSPVLTLDNKQEVNIYSHLKELFKDIVIVNEELPEIESDIDKLKRIIATTGELRVSELQTKMSIAIGKVKELLTELVNEGWLKQEGKGRPYEINVEIEELNKWKDDK